MNFYDVLAAEKWGGGIPTINFFDLLFAQSISGEQWQVYEGTLPATLNANGSDLRQYQIYGADGGVGDDSGTAYGYVVPMSVQMGELRQDVVQGGWTVGSGNSVVFYNTGDVAPLRCCVGKFYVDSTKTYKISVVPSSLQFGVRAANANDTQLFDTGWVENPVYELTPTATMRWIGITIRKPDNSNITPADVQCVKIITSEATTIPIYIGSNPLETDEYVSYSEQKIYRMNGGVLIPTDPPVPLPALPTCEGTTIVDYAGQSVAPEKVLLEYAKGGN